MDAKTFIPIHAMSRRLGLSVSWIKAEAKAGRIPHIYAGRKLMFNPEVVELTLIDRALQKAVDGKVVSRG